MPQPNADQLQSIPMSPNLSQSFGRAREFAREQAHRALLLEHLLLALTEDPEASGVLRACNVDIVRLSTDVSGYLGRLTEDMRAAPGTEPSPDAELLRVIEAARQAAQQSRRRAIDGAIVLAAIVGDGKSPAAGLLKTHGMTFDEAIRTLQKASAQARTKQYSTSTVRTQPEPSASPATKEAAREPAPPPDPERSAPVSAASQPTGSSAGQASSGQTVDDILAAARARIQQRAASAAVNTEPKPKPKPKPAADLPPKAEPQLPLMNLSSFTAAPAPPLPDMPDLPPLIARPPPDGPPPVPPGASPALPLPSGPPPLAAHEPSGPPRAFQRPSEGGPRLPPAPPRRPDAGHRGDRPDAAEPTLGLRPAAPNGVPGPRRLPSDATRPPARPGGPPPRSGPRPAAGPLMEAIPRRMRVGAATSAQVRINRDKVEALMQLLGAGRTMPPPDAAMAHVLSLRLKAPNGGFAIEADTPETQWVEASPGPPQEDHVGWRWTVTPLKRGRHRLQLGVAARTVGREGIGPEAAPPDRIIEVAVRPRRLRRLVRLAAFISLLALGIGLGRLSQDKLAQDIVDVVSAIWKNILGLLVTSGFVAG